MAVQNTQKILDTPENWDIASEGYSKKVAPRMMETFTDEFISDMDVTDEMDVLEVACGSGALTLGLSKKVKSLLAVDFAPKMIEITEKKLKAAGIENVTLRVMDGQALDLSDEAFDRAACSFGIMLFPDRHKGFTELQRVVKKGGKVVVTGWAGPDKFEAFGFFMEGINKAFPDMPKPPSPPPVFSLSDPEDFKTQMEAAGFQDVEVKLVSREMILDNFESVWEMITVGAPPVKLLFEKIGPEGQNKVRDAFKEIIENKFGNGPVKMINHATVGVGRVA